MRKKDDALELSEEGGPNKFNSSNAGVMGCSGSGVGVAGGGERPGLN